MQMSSLFIQQLKLTETEVSVYNILVFTPNIEY